VPIHKGRRDSTACMSVAIETEATARRRANYISPSYIGERGKHQRTHRNAVHNALRYVIERPYAHNNTAPRTIRVKPALQNLVNRAFRQGQSLLLLQVDRVFFVAFMPFRQVLSLIDHKLRQAALTPLSRLVKTIAHAPHGMVCCPCDTKQFPKEAYPDSNKRFISKGYPCACCYPAMVKRILLAPKSHMQHDGPRSSFERLAERVETILSFPEPLIIDTAARGPPLDVGWQAY
jgi:hypothetical protein